ncbi:MAG: single-stranded DNA-binding protein [Acidimicrobiia bacterium]|nr:single-stranded DNA-binding protein [Acidimicrobiia bacterium]
MDFNHVVLAGTLAVAPDLREFESGARLLRLLVTVHSAEPRRRVDVVPVTLWDPPATLLADKLERGRRVFVVGGVQRRFWAAQEGRRNRVEIVAHHVAARPIAEDETDG